MLNPEFILNLYSTPDLFMEIEVNSEKSLFSAYLSHELTSCKVVINKEHLRKW